MFTVCFDPQRAIKGNYLSFSTVSFVIVYLFAQFLGLY